MRPTMRSVPLLTLAALAAAFTVAAGCAHAPAGAAAPARATAATVADLFPLAVGNEWTWEDQSPSLPAAQRAAPRTVRILEKTADGFFRDSERGELKVSGACLQDRLRRLLCGPVAAGTAWTSVVSVSSTERYEIAAVGETVATPAGTFTGCVRVRALNRAAPGTDLVNEISYAPGVGPVRIETFAVAGGQAVPQFKALLRAYKVEGR
jgi:hypothetical protein